MNGLRLHGALENLCWRHWILFLLELEQADGRRSGVAFQICNDAKNKIVCGKIFPAFESSNTSRFARRNHTHFQSTMSEAEGVSAPTPTKLRPRGYQDPLETWSSKFARKFNENPWVPIGK